MWTCYNLSPHSRLRGNHASASALPPRFRSVQCSASDAACFRLADSTCAPLNSSSSTCIQT